MGIKHKYRIEKPVDSGVSAHVSSGSEHKPLPFALSPSPPTTAWGIIQFRLLPEPSQEIVSLH